MRYEARMQMLATLAAGLVAGSDEVLTDEYVARRAVNLLSALESADDKYREEAHDHAVAALRVRTTNHGAF